MGSIDDVTWQVLTVVLTAFGLVTSALLWRRRGPASGIRGVAWSLLPLAALLTGTWRLVWEIGDAVLSWAVRFAFSPVVWLGIAVAGVSAALFATSSVMRRRGLGMRGRGSAKRSAVTTGAERPAAEAPAKKSADDEMAEIEAILKKRGIE